MRISVEFSTSSVDQLWLHSQKAINSAKPLDQRTALTVLGLLHRIKAMDDDATSFIEECYALQRDVNPLTQLLVLGHAIGAVRFNERMSVKMSGVPSFTIL